MAKRHDFTMMLDGNYHQVQVELKWTGKVIVYVNGQEVARKTDWVGSMDVLFQYNGHNVAVSKVRRNFRMAVDGRYIDTNEPFTPIADMPAVIKVGIGFAVAEIILCFVLGGGLIGAVFGLLAYFLFISIGRSKLSKGAKTAVTIIGILVLYAIYIVWLLVVVAAYLLI